MKGEEGGRGECMGRMGERWGTQGGKESIRPWEPQDVVEVVNTLLPLPNDPLTLPGLDATGIGGGPPGSELVKLKSKSKGVRGVVLVNAVDVRRRE